MEIQTVADLKACLDDGRAASVEKIVIDGAEAAEAVEILERTDGGRFPKLVRLMLVRGNLTSLPANLGTYTSLEQLVVWENALTAFPDSTASCTQLWWVHAMNNKLTSIPEVLSRLQALKELDVTGNQLERLSTRPLASVTKLDLRSNGLAAIGDDVAMFPRLATLSASSNQIASISDRIGTLAELSSLDVSHNALTELPAALASTPLATLNLDGNPLGALPAFVLGMKSLETLNLWGCGLRELPEAIGELANLTFLDVSSNQLTAFPRSLANLTNLTWLNVTENPGTSEAAAAVSGDDVAAVLAALASGQDKDR